MCQPSTWVWWRRRGDSTSCLHIGDGREVDGRMDAQVWLSVATFVVGALWTTGGRAALQRRVIEHELDLAQKLKEQPMQGLMEKRAHDRAAVYLARGLESDATRRGLMPMVPLVAGFFVMLIATRLPERTLDWVVVSITLLGMILLGGGFGAVVDALFRDGRAWVGSARAKQARRRLTAFAAEGDEDASTSLPPPTRGENADPP